MTKYKYVDFPIYNNISLELAKWLEVEPNRIKASKIYKTILKYEKLWHKNYDSTVEYGKQIGDIWNPLNSIPPKED